MPNYNQDLQKNNANLKDILTQAESLPVVPDWAMQPNKPTYTASEVGALPNSTEIPSPQLKFVNVSKTLADTTPTEIMNWKKEGNDVIAFYKEAEADLRAYHYDYFRATETEAIFEGFTRVPNGDIWYSLMIINADKSVKFIEQKFFLNKGGYLGGYINAAGFLSGTWLQTRNLQAVTIDNADKIAVLNAEGWIYYINKSDLVSNIATEVAAILQGGGTN